MQVRITDSVPRTEMGHQHFRRPMERRFLAEERDKVTILIGGLTWRHERLIRAVFEGCGYRCECLPSPDLVAYQAGRENCNIGQCNPSYFTIGNLLQFLRGLEERGLSRDEIVQNYVFFTAGSCGPCRFGMYETEYRMALRSAGFAGFRVLNFQQEHGWQAASGEPGLKFTVDFGMGMFNALILGDVVSDIGFRLRPYEVIAGATNRAIESVVARLERYLREEPRFELSRPESPSYTSQKLEHHRQSKCYKTFNTLGKVREHLRGDGYRIALRECSDLLAKVEVDRLRVKPVLKIVGEFWAQLTEGPGNYDLFSFLEREGAELIVDPISTWLTYLMYQAKVRAQNRHGLAREHRDTRNLSVPKLDWAYLRRQLMFSLGQRIYEMHYRKAVELLGDVAHPLVSQQRLASLAHPHYNQLARGGEGHLEVGKSIYYTESCSCHMIVAVKPFGCLPSTQSDAVNWSLMSRHSEMLFVSIETSGEGEINALSRVQLALADARTKALDEFDRCLRSTGLKLDSIRQYVAGHPELRHPFYHVPKHPGVAGGAANFILHVAKRMAGGRARIPVPYRRNEPRAM